MKCTHTRFNAIDSKVPCHRCEWDQEDEMKRKSKTAESDGIITKLVQLILNCFPCEGSVSHKNKYH